jgi:hypothetical protein
VIKRIRQRLIKGENIKGKTIEIESMTCPSPNYEARTKKVLKKIDMENSNKIPIMHN